jgi:high-affinity nickel-transport protein
MYPVGFLFGLGFDTTTEVAILATTAVLAGRNVPWYAIACLPIIFAAGMTLMDTSDGIFMNMAYGWAFFNPVRKVYYNLAITSLSVAICFFIGGVEVLGLLAQEIPGLPRHRGFWGLMHNFNINIAGFVIAGMFVATWVLAMVVWKYGKVEERWAAKLR